MIGVAAFCLASTSVFSQNFRVQKIQICANSVLSVDSPCVEVKPPFDNLSRTTFAKSRIDFKIWIAIDGSSLEFIEKNNSVLPVNIAIWRDGSRLDADTNIGITQEKWEQDGAMLAAAVAEHGGTLWRTRGNVQIAGARTIRIEVHDALDIQTSLGNEPARISFQFSR